tara:strand:+ start:3525 stop:3686 length:162 start_codon:yes stop_codon:yes gene_type:complete
MIEFLLYANLNCLDASDMISRIKKSEHMSKISKMEVIEVLQEATPECKWDAND